MTAVETIPALTGALFFLFFIRAVTMFVRVQKMPDSAERTNLRARAQAQAGYAVLCLLFSYGLSAYIYYQAATLTLPQ